MIAVAIKLILAAVAIGLVLAFGFALAFAIVLGGLIGVDLAGSITLSSSERPRSFGLCSPTMHLVLPPSSMLLPPSPANYTGR